MSKDSNKYETALGCYLRNDYALCVKDFLDMSAEGDAKSSFYAAAIFLKGNREIEADATQARALYALALEQAFLPGAALSLALMEYHGEGGPKDYKNSMRHYLMVKGNPFAKIMMGTMKLHGYVGERDENGALNLFEAAWSLGHPLGLRAAAGIRFRRGQYFKGLVGFLRSSILIMWFYGIRQLPIVKSPNEELGFFWKRLKR